MPANNGERQYFSTPVKCTVATVPFGVAVTLAGGIATSGQEAIGINLGEDINSGQTMPVGYLGELPFAVGQLAQLSAKALLTVNASGRCILAVSASLVVGTAIGDSFDTPANVDSGGLGRGLFNFANPWLIPTSALATGATFYR